MKTEILIYAYLAVCAAMIGFNIACIFVFRVKDKRLYRHSQRFIKVVRQVIEDRSVTEKHCKYLSGKLKKINNLMAFDKTLEELYAQNPEQIEDYITRILLAGSQLCLQLIYLLQKVCTFFTERGFFCHKLCIELFIHCSNVLADTDFGIPEQSTF